MDKREIIWLEFADLDRDGDQDLLTLLLLPNSGQVSRHFAMYEYDGKGVFKEHLWIHPTWGAESFVLADVDGHGYRDATILDVDGNGLPDLLFAHEKMEGNGSIGSHSALFMNQGQGKFQVATVSVLGKDRSGLTLAQKGQ